MEYSFRAVVSAYLFKKYPKDFSDYGGESILDIVIKNKIDRKDHALIDKAYKDFFDIIFAGISDEKELKTAFEKYLGGLEGVTKK